MVEIYKYAKLYQVPDKRQTSSSLPFGSKGQS